MCRPSSLGGRAFRIIHGHLVFYVFLVDLCWRKGCQVCWLAGRRSCLCRGGPPGFHGGTTGIFSGIGQQTLHLRTGDHYGRRRFERTHDAPVNHAVRPSFRAPEQSTELCRREDEAITGERR